MEPANSLTKFEDIPCCPEFAKCLRQAAVWLRWNELGAKVILREARSGKKQFPISFRTIRLKKAAKQTKEMREAIEEKLKKKY